MKQYPCTQEPIKIYGLQHRLLPHRFWRLPEEILAIASEGVAKRAKSPVGGRIRFRTDSSKITINMKLKNNNVDWAIPLSGSAGADVYIGMKMNIRYAGLIAPKSYEVETATLTFEKNKEVEDITIHLPRNVELEDVQIELEDDARLEAPTPYTFEIPMVFYGSSITEGGCATRPANAYTALLSRWLDADYINLGFSGSAKGEPELAAYIAGLEMSVFIMDYDHNAPTVDHLERTHEPFFKEIRKAQPELPILFLTKPDFDLKPEEAAQRRAIIQRTYGNAKAAGDEFVHFIDGERFFGETNRESCTIEGCHPNDLGFMRMAEVIYPDLGDMLRYPKKI
ncbi:SGNH/GDSL hydrolase family protein [Paenibacillus qinlingensis]|uniref:Lysophospholipase L1-like esterase n=1 Tax=Paenibacillus qinlingensis TaxID=1837343 RepID=A0ABU1NWR0_9BACL|nr:SGNH/GDSL hydrolase family protein [Paenibacillus qinlingensis]MDR6551888.1 lysophospholipase L1-like esterase [Paenibacillus qinlingensis]